MNPRVLLVVLAAVFSGCASLDRLRAGTPDLTAPSGAGIYWHGLRPNPAAVPMVESIYPAGMKVCPADKQKALKSYWQDSIINWEATDPFWCQRWVHGCNPLRATVDVASPLLLPDELGHVIWSQCFGRPGESTDANGVDTYDADFQQWLKTLK